MKRLHVAMVSVNASPLATSGDQSVHVAALAVALAARGAEVVVYARRDDPCLPASVRLAPDVRVRHVDAGPPRALAERDAAAHLATFAAGLEAAWRDERPDIAHTHSWTSGVAGTRAGRRLEIPVVGTLHALGSVEQRHSGNPDAGARIRMERQLLHWCDRTITACSEDVFELARMGARRQTLHVVPSGVDTDLFSADGPSRSPAIRGRKVVLSLGPLVETAGGDDLVRAVAQLPDTELWIGGGPRLGDIAGDADVERLRATARRARVSRRVKFLGRVDQVQVPMLLRRADVVACTPWYEPFGLVALEAMACCRPVVASAVGVLADTVLDGITGFHVPTRRPYAIAKSVGRLLADPVLAWSFGAAGLHRVRTRYRWDAAARSTESVYRSVIDARHVRRLAR